MRWKWQSHWWFCTNTNNAALLNELYMCHFMRTWSTWHFQAKNKLQLKPLSAYQTIKNNSKKQDGKRKARKQIWKRIQSKKKKLTWMTAWFHHRISHFKIKFTKCFPIWPSTMQMTKNNNNSAAFNKCRKLMVTSTKDEINTTALRKNNLINTSTTSMSQIQN